LSDKITWIPAQRALFDEISATGGRNLSGGYIHYSSRSGGGNENILFIISSVRATVASLKHYCP